MVIGKCTEVLRGTSHATRGSGVEGTGWGEGITWDDLSMEEFIMREENFHDGAAGFSSII